MKPHHDKGEADTGQRHHEHDDMTEQPNTTRGEDFTSYVERTTTAQDKPRKIRKPTAELSKQAKYQRRKHRPAGVTEDESDALYAMDAGKVGSIAWWLELTRLRGSGAVVAVPACAVRGKGSAVLDAIRRWKIGTGVPVFARVRGSDMALCLSLSPLDMPRSAFGLTRLARGASLTVPLSAFPSGLSRHAALQLLWIDRDLCVRESKTVPRPHVVAQYAVGSESDLFVYRDE